VREHLHGRKRSPTGATVGAPPTALRPAEEPGASAPTPGGPAGLQGPLAHLARCNAPVRLLAQPLSDAFGPLYGEDLIDSRMPTPEEREQLGISPDTPVTIIQGVNRDSQHRALHYIVKVTVAGRMQYGYRFGHVPDEVPG
jgi:hypothetical protein